MIDLDALIAELRAARAVIEAARAVYENDDAFTYDPTDDTGGGKQLRDGILGAALEAYKKVTTP